ncbi:MAG TPA: SDR family NAD(P)-dependent oxidoreductase [Vicinamibacterales bacterium]|nr:SDR family NAD(P)-dependent oxidoreductase [Vicinamibacterales bacterium]
MLLENRIAIVTGAARGIGLATVERFAREGATVVAADLDAATAAREAARLQSAGFRVTGARCDVGDRASVESLVREIESTHGRVDVLVNNAGIAGPTGPLEHVTDRDWDEVMRVDLRSVFLGCQAVLPGMKARRYGRIVNVASIAGKEGNPNAVPYSTAKAGVIGLTKALAKEVASFGIYVNAVAPAVIDTPILQQVPQSHIDYMVQKIPLGRMGRPEEVAALIAWLASDEASFTTGQCVDISGGRATY